MRQILRKIIPEPIRKMKIQYIEKKSLKDGARIKKQVILKDPGKPLIVVFVVYMPQEWNSLEAVYLMMKKDSRFKAYLLVTPHESILSDGRTMSSYDFFSRFGNDVIDAKLENGWYNVADLHPDIIFRQESFDDNFPSEYSGKKLAEIAKLYYIPYAYTNTAKHIPMEFHLGFISYCKTVFAANTETYNYLLTLKKTYRELADLSVYDIGFPRYDLLGDVELEDAPIRHFLWIPRYSLDFEGNDGTNFFKYKKNIIKYFSENKNIELRIRPHPLMFKEFVKRGAMSSEDVESFINEINGIGNITLDNEMDYMKTFDWSDAMIADHSSLNFEYLAMGKPVIYCNDDAEKSLGEMSECVYDGTDWEKLKDALDCLLKNADVLKDKRTNIAIKANRSMNRHCAEEIINICFE